MTRVASLPRHQGRFLSARADLTYPADAVPFGLTRMADALAGVTHKAQAEALPVTCVGLRRCTLVAIRAITAPAAR